MPTLDEEKRAHDDDASMMMMSAMLEKTGEDTEKDRRREQAQKEEVPRWRAPSTRYLVLWDDQRKRQAQEREADVPERRAWATAQGSGYASPAQGVGLRADWLGRPHLPRRASKFVSISDLQPHRCLHPITKQYLATLLCPGTSPRPSTKNRWDLRALWSHHELPTARTRTYIPAGRRDVPNDVPLRSLYPSASLVCHVPLARAPWGNLPPAIFLWRDPTSRCAAWAGIP